MKKILHRIAVAVLLICTLCACFALPACGKEGEKRYSLSEATFYKVMYNMVYFPDQYLGATIDLDCFVYEIEDAKTGELFVCGVRKCPSNVGCKCGNDSVLGFLLSYGGTIPAARNQTANDSDKTWIHIAGSLAGTDLTGVNVYTYDAEGNKTDSVEKIYFCTMNVSELTEIDGSGLNYYVS